MNSLEVFAWGCIGSLAVDVVTNSKHFESSKKLPVHLHRVGYYVTRILLALLAGSLAVAYGIQKELLAFHIGAASPLLIMAASQGITGPAARIVKDKT